MTYGEKTTLGEAYVGIDFGTSNSSISYVEQQAVRVYNERATEKSWCELNDLVNVLPYPASNPLVKFIGSTNERDLKDHFSTAFESILFCILTVAFVDYRVQPEATKSKIFNQFTKGSAGPIWATLRSILEKNAKRAMFMPKLSVLLELRNKVAIDSAIIAINDHKHHRESNYQGYREVLAILGNTLKLALEGWRFGQFEGVVKRGFSSVYTGLFRSAHGAHAPFIDIYQYQGAENFSNMEAVLVSPEGGLAVRLSPMMFWTQADAKGEQDVALLDSPFTKSCGYRTIAGGRGVSIEANSEHADLYRMCNEAMLSDGCEFGVPCTKVQLTAR